MNKTHLAHYVAALMLLAGSVQATDQPPVPGNGASVSQLLTQMMLERVAETADGRTDLEDYDRDCKGRICRYTPRPEEADD